MTVLVGNSPSTAPYFARNLVVPVDYKLEVSQRLVDAALAGDLKTACQCIIDPFVDVNFVGAVSLRSKRTEIVLCDEQAHEVRAEYEQFRTEVTALFLAAHGGNLTLVRKLLSAGANVEQKLFKGYATTAAVREGHIEILELLINAGAGQNACEEALLEASIVGHHKSCDLLMRSQMVRSHVAERAIVLASYRGFVDVVRSLIATGVDANATSRVLLQSSKPALHINADCSALVAAIISRQISVVKLLLQEGVRTDTNVRIGAWSWDINTGEEFRVGAGLAEPYPVTWCAVEYFEASGAILTMLLQHLSPNAPHCGRTLVHHAILCRNETALSVLVKCGADTEIKPAVNLAKPAVNLVKPAVNLVKPAVNLAKPRELPVAIQSLTAVNLAKPAVNLIKPRELPDANQSLAAVDFHSQSSSEIGETLIAKFSPPDQDQELEAPETPAKCTESDRNLPKFGNVDASDEEDDSTPLMQPAKGGGRKCEVLISEKHELIKQRKSVAEDAILNEMARKVVVEGERVKKHTKCGKGSPHKKMLRMVERSGVLSWGKSGRRNVICRHADVGPTPSFMWNRRRKSDCNEAGIFHVVTTRNKEVHFVCAGGEEAARLWVRGIKILTREAIFGGTDD